MINRLSKEVHANAQSKGFFDDKKNIGEMLCLIHSEVSEALESDRNEQYASMTETLWDDMNRDLDDDYFKHAFKEYCKDTFEDELADIMIRVMDLAAFKGVDLERHIKAKMRYNALRPHKHGKKY